MHGRDVHARATCCCSVLVVPSSSSDHVLTDHSVVAENMLYSLIQTFMENVYCKLPKFMIRLFARHGRHVTSIVFVPCYIVSANPIMTTLTALGRQEISASSHAKLDI